jgi:hypothetical protein
LAANAPLHSLAFLDYSEPIEVDKRIVFRTINAVSGKQNVNNRISQIVKAEQEDRRGEPQPIGAILAELLAQYQTRFPEVHITAVETPAVAI